MSVALDAADSYDPDGDLLFHSWVATVTSGTTMVTVSDAEASSTSVTWGGMPATSGVTTTASIEILYTASDCSGASDSVAIQAEYSCTGI